MRVATFNLENLDLPIERRLTVLRSALQRLEADVLCLQEVNSQKVPAVHQHDGVDLDRFDLSSLSVALRLGCDGVKRWSSRSVARTCGQ